MDVPVNDIYIPCLTNESRYLILYGSAGSGKSRFIAQKIIARCLKNKERILCLRKVKFWVKDSVYKEISDVLGQLPVKVQCNKSTHSFIFPNGSEIITAGLDDPEKLKSIAGITSIWIEEATELTEDDFNQLDLRLRGETATYKQIIISFNPIDENHWIKKKFFDNQNSDTTIIRSTYKDNYFIDSDYIRLLEERLSSDENLYRIYVQGQWGRIKTGGEYYSQFKYNKHVKDVFYDKDLPLHISFDQNVVPYITAIITQIVKIDNIYYIRYIDEFCLENPRNNTESLCRAILDKYENPTSIYFYGDASGRKRDTRGIENDYDIVERIFAKFLNNSSNRVPHSNPRHNKRRQFINQIFANVYPIRIEIHPDLKNLIGDLENVKEDITGEKLKVKTLNKATLQSYEKYGHTSDAGIDYLIMAAFGSFYNN